MWQKIGAIYALLFIYFYNLRGMYAMFTSLYNYDKRSKLLCLGFFLFIFIKNKHIIYCYRPTQVILPHCQVSPDRIPCRVLQNKSIHRRISGGGHSDV